MHTTSISCLKFKRGTSTILGTLIFVGIMFTAVIPMLLVMRQADTLHEMRKYELKRLDDERIREEVYVYAFSPPETSPILTLRVENRGDFVVKIVRMWINDSPHLLDDFVVQPMSSIDMQLDFFTGIPGTNYFIKVNTDRGNIFSSYSGSIFCNSEGSWDSGLFTINFIISYPAAGWFDVEVRFSNENEDILDLVPDGEFSIHKSSFESAFDFINVPYAQKYHVRIIRSGMEIYSNFKTIYWPYGPSEVWVYA